MDGLGLHTIWDLYLALSTFFGLIWARALDRPQQFCKLNLFYQASLSIRGVKTQNPDNKSDNLDAPKESGKELHCARNFAEFQNEIG